MLTPTTHADLEVRVLDRAPDPSGRLVYRVELTLDHAQEASGLADLDGLAPWDPAGPETRDAYGTRLFEQLFSDEALRAAWHRMAGQSPLRRVRLRIEPQLPHLHVLQWELLRTPDEVGAADLALRTSTPFSRYLARESQPGRPVLARPIRVLVAVANPANLQKYGLQAVDAAAELAGLSDATAGIRDADGQPAITFDLLQGPCTLDAIRDRLKEGCHVLHFIGHGLFAHGQGGAPDQSVLLLEDDAGNATRTADTAIAAMIANLLAGTAAADERLRLVFLESCETAKRSANDAFRGLAPQLVQAGIAAVVAMQDLIEVKTARPFAATFYRQLLRHGLVDLACNEARDAVKTQKLRGAEVPVLFMRLRSGELLRVEGEVRGDARATFWNRLIARMHDDTCVPFLGPRVNRGVLPRPETMAVELASANGYGLSDRDNLARVAQFESFKDPDAFRAMYLDILKQSLCRVAGAAFDAKARAKTSLTALVETIGWDPLLARVEELRVYEQLASLELPLYITSSVDSFMVEALRHRPGADPASVRRIGPRWRKTTEGTPSHSLLHPEPSNETPYVLHLNGFDDAADPDQREHIALSEDDMLAAYLRLARDQVEILPSNVLTRLSRSSWMFVGYNLHDWELRVLLQGLLQPIAQADARKKLHVGVQFESTAGAGGLTEEEVQKYLQDYLGRRFNITVYWGTPGQFVSQLYERFLAA